MKYLHIRKNSVNFLNVSFVVKEGSNNKNLDISLFAYSKGVGKSLFCCSRPKDTEVMNICLHHVEVFVRNRFFFVNFAFVCSKKVDKRTNLIDSLFMVNMIVKMSVSYINPLLSYNHFSKCL